MTAPEPEVYWKPWSIKREVEQPNLSGGNENINIGGGSNSDQFVPLLEKR
jgi:hypothetical protein